MLGMLAGIAAPASADWQWTKWGMRPEEVAAAAPARVAPYSDPGIDTEAMSSRQVTNHAALGFQFSVALLYDRRSNLLSQVRLVLRDEGKCSALRGELDKLYGRPESIGSMGFARWRDTAGGNLVSLEPIGGCWLVYQPIPTRSGSGL